MHRMACMVEILSFIRLIRLSQGPDCQSNEVRYTVFLGNTKDNGRVNATTVKLLLEMVKRITIQDWN